MSVCYVCGEHVDAALAIEHFGCHCKAHDTCLQEPINFKHCPAHDGSGVVARRVAAVVHEPRTTDGINYVMQPGQRRAPYKLAQAAAYVPFLGSRFAETVENSKSPAFLLAHHVPIRTIMERNGLGLDHFLRDGIELDDFLTNGYVWNDLLEFEAVAGKRGGVTPLQALCIGLNAQATHFRDYPTALPYEQVRAHAEFEPYDLCESFGLHFPDDGPLECNGDTNWNALHCVKLGLNVDDLLAFGLRYREQYEDLMHELPVRKQQEAARALGFTDAHVKSLISLEAQDEQESYAKAAAAARVPLRAIAKPMPEPEQQPEPETVTSMLRPIVRPNAARPVAAAAPIFQHDTPPPKPRATARTYADKRTSRFDRHGARFVAK